MSKPAARVGDMHTCPMVTPGLPPIPHVGGAILPPGIPNVLIGGMPAAVVGDMCVCTGPPDTIVKGSLGVFIGGKSAARVGDTTAHGGVIIAGCLTVLIGDIEVNLVVDHKATEEKVKDLVKNNKYKEAVELIIETYRFKNPYLKLVIEDSLDGAYGTTSGEIRAGAEQTIKIPKTLFDEEFNFIVRTIGHEYQHVLQRSQEKPLTNQKEREFLAWSWEALDESTPPYSLETSAYHAEKAITYYDKMPNELQDKHKLRKKKLDELISESEQ